MVKKRKQTLESSSEVEIGSENEQEAAISHRARHSKSKQQTRSEDCGTEDVQNLDGSVDLGGDNSTDSDDIGAW